MNTLFKQSLLAGLATLPLAAISKEAPKPMNSNIILIFCDDLGYDDLSCYGASQFICGR